MKKETRAIVMLLAILLPILALYYKHLNLGLDLRGGTYVVLQADEKTGKVESDTMDKVRDIVERRVNSLGVAEPNIQKSGDNRLIVELAGVKNSQAAIDLIGTTAKLEFKLMQEDGSLGETLLTGESIKNATLVQGQLGQPEVSFELNDSGANKFAQITKDNVGKQLAIVLDGKIQSAPKINSEIPGGKGVITTGDQKASQDLVNLLKSGALPVDIKILETRTIGASLGVESIKQTQLAGIIAIILISIFMIAIYKIPGLIADFALYIFGLHSFRCIKCNRCNDNTAWYCWIYIISRNGSRCKCYYF
jgi:preprotein translocase subunit SecD